jgi:phage-related protein
VPGLDDVTQKFIADVAAYVDPLREAISVAQEFADANRSDDDSVEILRDSLDRLGVAIDDLTMEMRGVRDTVAESAEVFDILRDHAEESAESLHQVRDAAVEDDAALDGVRDRAEETASALSRLRDKATEAAASMSELGASSDLASAALGPGAGAGGMVGLIAALVVAIAAVTPAVAAAAMSIGAFAGFAIPTFTKVYDVISGADPLSSLNQAQLKVYNGIENIISEYDKLAAAMQPEVLGVFNQALGIAANLLPKIVPLAQAGGQALSAMLSIIGRGLESQQFTDFLQLMTQMAVPATVAITHLAGALLQFLGGAIKALAPLSVPFINAFSGLVHLLSGPVTAALTVVITLFNNVYRAVSPLLPVVGKLATMLITMTGGGLEALVPLLNQLAKDLIPLFTSVIKTLQPILDNMVTPNSPVLTALTFLVKDVLPPLIHWLTELLNFVAAHPFLGRLAVDALSAAFGFKALMKISGPLLSAIGAMLTPVGLVITAIVALAIAFYELYTHSKAVRDVVHDVAQALKADWAEAIKIAGAITEWFTTSVLPRVKQALGDLATWWHQHGAEVEQIARGLWSTLAAIFTAGMKIITAVVNVALTQLNMMFGGHWQEVLAITVAVLKIIGTVVSMVMNSILDIVGIVLDLLTGHWGQAWSDLKSLVETNLNGSVNIIKDILGAIPSYMLSAGEHMVEELASGMMDALPAAASAASAIASKITSFFGLSPAQAGPLSGSGAPEVRGMHFAQDLARGILSGRSAVQAAVTSLSGSLSGTTLAAGAATGSGVHVTVPVTLAPGMGALTSPQFLQGIQGVVQEAILRYTQTNQSNALFGYGRRS